MSKSLSGRRPRPTDPLLHDIHIGSVLLPAPALYAMKPYGYRPLSANLRAFGRAHESCDRPE